jgi:hypothetical protein
MSDLVHLVDVLRVWHEWRQTLPKDRPFFHSDGIRFVQKLDDLLALSASGAGEDRQPKKFQSCHCPAAHGEPCPLTVDECAARVPGVPAAGLGDLSRSGLEVAPSAAERTTRQILCSECFDARGFNNVHGTFPQVYCDACGRLCMGYGTRPAAERT